jgi:hypothetical protein
VTEYYLHLLEAAIQHSSALDGEKQLMFELLDKLSPQEKYIRIPAEMVQEILHETDKIPAIKLLWNARAKDVIGLSQAKKIVEAIRAGDHRLDNFGNATM